MAAYAALVSVMHIIKQIEHHPRPPLSLDKTQVESLSERVTFLQEFLEGYSHVAGYSKEADPLELRIADAAYAAEDLIESHVVDKILPRTTTHGNEINLYEGLEQVIDEMESIKRELMEIKEKMGFQHLLRQRSSIPAASFRPSSTGQNMTMVGFDDVLIEVMDKLTRGQLDRQIIPIVGMGGIGKTTLARNVYKNPVVVQCFDVLAWVTVSQEYRLTDILEELQEGEGDLGQMNACELGGKLHKRLSGRRYLIILDDIWDIQVWDRIRRFFPDNKNGSRIVITTRISDFQLIDSCVFKMGFLDEDKSWTLFSKIVFREKSCPVELKDIGRNIVKNCRGLPLSIVVVGGLLAKSEYTQEYWKYIANNLNSIVNSEDDESCLKILHMSYNQLPIYVKPCFLYMGVYSEDKSIRVSKLVKLWVSEGFLKPISGKSLEEIAEECLKELVNRNLVLVHELGCTGNIKYCYIHDLLRDLSLREAQKQRFYSVIRQQSLDTSQDLSTQRRIVIPDSISRVKIRNDLQSMSLARSLICDSQEALPLHNYRLLRIMSCSNFDNRYCLQEIFQLVNSRCIFLYVKGYKFPPSAGLLWNLHTLIVLDGMEFRTPFEIWNMPLIRHLEFGGRGGGVYLQYPPDGKVTGRDDIILENLQTLGTIINFKCSKEVIKRIPNIKKLKICYSNSVMEDHCPYNLEHLQKLESLYLKYSVYDRDFLQKLTFPNLLKKLTLNISYFRNWEGILEKIGSLPRLEKLTLWDGCFKKGKWETVEGQFSSLKFLKIKIGRGLKYWTTESSHFPCLEHLVLESLVDFNGIPSEIGEIETLKSITLVQCNNSTIVSAKKIQKDQEELYGEAGLQVRVQTSSSVQKVKLQRNNSSADDDVDV